MFLKIVIKSKVNPINMELVQSIKLILVPIKLIKFLKEKIITKIMGINKNIKILNWNANGLINKKERTGNDAS